MLFPGKMCDTDLPKEMGNLTNLTELNIWANNIKKLPEEILKLPKLKDVELSLNQSKLNQKLIESVQKNDYQLAGKLISFGADVNYKWTGYSDKTFTGLGKC